MLPLPSILWNLFLALIPVAVAYPLAAGVKRCTLRAKSVPWAVWMPLALIWFVFLPNSCYLLTEWRHFLFDPQFAAIRDAAEWNPIYMVAVAKAGFFFLLYSLSGVLCFTFAIRPIERLLRQARFNLLPLGVPFFLLISLGVYMGLNVRLNSWDLVKAPEAVFQTATRALYSPLLLKMIVIFAVLLWLMYENVDLWADGAALRVKRWIGRQEEASPVEN
jgi:uncharacterized membrane protein